MTAADNAPTAVIDRVSAGTDDSPQRGGAHRSTPRSYGWLLALPVTLVALAVGGYRVQNRQLWEDEYTAWHADRFTYKDMGWLLDHKDLVITPYYLLMHGWIDVFGDSERSMRMPSVIAMALTAGLLVLIGRRLFNNVTGVTAGLMFAAIPTISRYAQEARPYALAVFFATLSTLLLLRAFDDPTWRRWLLYGLAVVATGLAHIVAATILVAHFLAVRRAVKTTDILRYWRWLAALILVICTIGPFAQYASRQSDAISWIKVDRETVLDLPLDLIGSWLVAAALAGLAVLGAGLMIPARRRQPLVLLGAWALFAPIFTLATYPWLNLFLFRYLLFTVPALALLAARGLDGLGRALALRAGGRVQATVAGLVAAAALPAIGWLALPAQQDVRRDLLEGNPDYRAVAGAITSSMQPGDGIAYGGTQWLARRALAYELRTSVQPRDVFLSPTLQQVGGFVAQECPAPADCLGGAKRIWLVNTARSGDVFTEMPTAKAKLLRERFTTGQVKQFTEIRLVLLTAKK